MRKPSTWLLEHRRNVHSQTGEDGIIDRILSVLPARNEWCVEFGACDGAFLSNTCRLIEERGYSAVLIEASVKKFRELTRRFGCTPRVFPVNAFVGFQRRDGLDALLSRQPIPRDFDFLSIDIDGNDYHTWHTTVEYRPKVVCIEFNPTIATDVTFVQAPDPGISQGSSLLALTELGKQKGYELVCVLPWNAIFVDECYFPLFEIDDNSPARMRTDTSLVTHMFVGYDGSIHLVGAKQLAWHGVELDEGDFQPLPKRLRKYRGNYSQVEKALYAGFLLLTSPRAFAKMARQRLR